MCIHYQGLQKECKMKVIVYTLSESFDCDYYEYRENDERRNNHS